MPLPPLKLHIFSPQLYLVRLPGSNQQFERLISSRGMPQLGLVDDAKDSVRLSADIVHSLQIILAFLSFHRCHHRIWTKELQAFLVFVGIALLPWSHNSHRHAASAIGARAIGSSQRSKARRQTSSKYGQVASRCTTSSMWPEQSAHTELCGQPFLASTPAVLHRPRTANQQKILHFPGASDFQTKSANGNPRIVPGMPNCAAEYLRRSEYVADLTRLF